MFIVGEMLLMTSLELGIKAKFKKGVLGQALNSRVKIIT